MAFTTSNFTQDQIDELVFNMGGMLPVPHARFLVHGGDGQDQENDLFQVQLAIDFDREYPSYIKISGPSGFYKLLTKNTTTLNWTGTANGLYINTSAQDGGPTGKRFVLTLKMPPDPVPDVSLGGNIPGDQTWWIFPIGSEMTLDNIITPTITSVTNTYGATGLENDPFISGKVEIII